MFLASLVQGESSKIESFDLHWISNQLSGAFQPNNRMISGHIVQNGQIVRFLMVIVDDVVGHFLIIDDLSMKLSLVARNHTIKVHEILSQSASLVKTSKLYHATSNNLILLDTENLLFLKLFDSIDDSKSHTDWQSWRHCNKYKVNQFVDDV